MEQFKKGDIIVSLSNQKSGDRDNPVPIRKNYIGENICEAGNYVFFRDTPPARGSYKSKNFRLASEDEKFQYSKGKELVESECPYEEGGYVTTLDNVISVDREYITLPKESTYFIDGIIKTADIDKQLMYFINEKGYYKVIDKFRLATQDEIIKYKKENGI